MMGDKVRDYIHQSIQIQHGDKGTPKKERRHKFLGGSVGPMTKRFLRGIDLIAIASGPHAGELLKTERKSLKLEFELKEELKRGIAFYERTFNELTGGFFFRCEKIEWI